MKRCMAIGRFGCMQTRDWGAGGRRRGCGGVSGTEWICSHGVTCGPRPVLLCQHHAIDALVSWLLPCFLDARWFL